MRVAALNVLELLVVVLAALSELVGLVDRLGQRDAERDDLVRVAQVVDEGLQLVGREVGLK